MRIELEVWDSPNSAGMVIDAIRYAKLALDREIGRALTAPSSYFMKTPPRQFTDYEARQKLEAFIRGEDQEAASPEKTTIDHVPRVAPTEPVLDRPQGNNTGNGTGHSTGKLGTAHLS